MRNIELAKFGDGQNMRALDLHVHLMESLNYKVDSIVGYGEGVFTLSVRMAHVIYPEIIIRIAQSHEDSTSGTVEVQGRSRLLTSYSFSSRGGRLGA